MTNLDNIRFGKAYEVRYSPELNAEEPWRLFKPLDGSVSFWATYEELTAAMLQEFDRGE